MTSPAHVEALRSCCERCRAKLAALIALGMPEDLAAFVADPLMGVDLRDRRWAERFDAEHPNRRATLAEVSALCADLRAEVRRT